MVNPLSGIQISGDWLADFAPDGWVALYADILEDATPYEDGHPDVREQIVDALHYNLLVHAFEQVFRAVELIKREGQKYLADSLNSLDNHAPHYGLWLTFLKLYRINQDQLNTLTEAHLNYYYKSTLQLCQRDAEPDRVHLLLELNKTIDKHLLEAGTLFKAGKDALGKEVSYALDADVVLNRAKVESLKAVHIAPIPDTDSPRFPLAAPVADSGDGYGSELARDNPQWRPFGMAGTPDGARIGFAIADRRLFLREGRRTILIGIDTDLATAQRNHWPSLCGPRRPGRRGGSTSRGRPFWSSPNTRMSPNGTTVRSW